MAGPFYVDDGGDGSDGLTWAKAYTSMSALDDAKTLVGGEIVYIGHNHICQFSHSAHRAITFDNTNPPGVVISATQGSDPPAYQKSATAQIDTSEGGYIVTLSGSASYYGVSIKSGSHIGFSYDPAAVGGMIVFDNCTFAPAANSQGIRSIAERGEVLFKSCTWDLTADGTTARSEPVWNLTGANCHIVGASFVNAGYRTGSIVGEGNSGFNSDVRLSGCDFRGFTNGTLCELSGNLYGSVEITNCITAATWGPHTGAMRSDARLMITNTGPANAKTYLFYKTGAGEIASSAAIYRTGGAVIEGAGVAYLVTTTAQCSEHSPLYTPWLYSTIASTGSKTFTCHITNDTADFTDAEVWLEVEYLKDADEAQWTLATDKRATITTTAAAQTDDTTSEWVGLNDDSQGLADYMQSLAVTATVGETGQYRARVAVGVASIAASRYFYVDPKIIVS